MAAARRYRDSRAEREEIERRRRDGAAFPDAGEMLEARAARLIDRNAVPAAAVVEGIRGEPLEKSVAWERIIGISKDLQAWSFLPRGARAARTVARVAVRENGRELPIGTGFLVSPRLLLTNHHVLPDEEAARQCFVEFDAQVTIDNVPGTATRLDLAPDVFFTAHEPLDYALALVASGGDGRPPGETFGWNRLSGEPGKLVIDEPVDIVGHPMGRLKEIALRDNALQTRLEDFLHYRTDTEPGSSGSPVFNDQWEVVALHHSGVPRTDAQGRILRRDGRVWQRGDGDDAIDWISNEGVRIDSILDHLATLRLDDARRALLAEVGVEPGPVETAAPSVGTRPSAAAPVAPIGARRPEEAATADAGVAARPTAFGGSRHLVFLHGRSQQGRDPVRLRRSWTAGLNHGLTEAGLAPVDPADVWFPFYGDVLARALEAREGTPRAIDRMVGEPAEMLAPTASSPRTAYEEILDEAARRSGLPPDGSRTAERFSWSDAVGRLQRRLGWLAARTDVDEWTIAGVFRDVAAYLEDQRVRDEVIDSVLGCMPGSGEVVLVGHSLGTVVAMDVISRLAPEPDVTLLVTAGSPLGMDSVHGRLLSKGPERPARVVRWLNVWCPTDAITIGCPLGDGWKDELTDRAVTNARGRAHSIQEYLSHPDVAEVIGARLAP
ncbi:hypothetical protein GCM10010405_09630 [Streptomyces macrosporus]|uniref:Serine protease n=1 Tax=Streptomyces macrosporus TaxID=44032 RepID=A0ABP5WPR5_9ACTN